MSDCERLARTGETPADWATDLAITIIADAFARRHNDAAELIAARLRLVRQEGVCQGAQETAAAIEQSFVVKVSPALQREYVADVQEHGIDGWDPR